MYNRRRRSGLVAGQVSKRQLRTRKAKQSDFETSDVEGPNRGGNLARLLTPKSPTAVRAQHGSWKPALQPPVYEERRENINIAVRS